MFFFPELVVKLKLLFLRNFEPI